MGAETFDCPVYEGFISEYDCAEISTGIHRGGFVNDGLPHLMDIRTALARKHRCHACPRCPAHYRPPGLPLMRTLRHLGFPDSLAETEELLHLIEARVGGYAARGPSGQISCHQLPSGIQLWLEWDPQLNLVHDVQAHFFTPNAMYLKADTLIRHNRGGQRVRNSFMAKLLRQAGQKGSTLRHCFYSPNLSMMHKEAVTAKNLVAQVTAFPAKLTLFEDPDAYLANREMELAAESFVSGLAMPEGDPKNPGADALLTGIVEKVRLVTNELTGLPFYHLELRCLGLVFDVVAAAGMFGKEPVPGNVLQGVCWLSARVLEYGYTGYEFEIDVTAPLTAARFEPLRIAIENLQPGERLYCGIDPPLGDIVYVRAKAEVEGISVEFRLDPQDEEELPKDEAPFRILRFYPVSKAMAVKIFGQTLVYLNPPQLTDAKDVTAEYLEDDDPVAGP